jgi:hypothetical protein
MSKQKQGRGKGPKAGAPQDKQERGEEEAAGDPLRAYPADPPRQNLPLLIISAVLFAAWFCYLAYVALAM